MSTKILTSLSDEKRNLQKQMGCMNGIFQLFHRHDHFLTGRRLSSHSHKKLVPGSRHNVELAYAEETASQWNREVGYEKHRTSTESSRTSSSSSFSSVDHNTSSKPSRTSSRRLSFAESLPQTIPDKHHESPSPLGRQSPDIRDVVKESMHREARGLSIKKVAKEEGKNHVLKHIDSPRPSHNSKLWKPSAAGAPWIAKEEVDTSVRQRMKDPPRFSYDSKFSEATRPSVKLKELPRLSLDSRDTRGRKDFDLTSTSLQRNTIERGVYGQTSEPSSNRSSTVIAKLMGLEAFPDHPFADGSNTTTSGRDSISRTSVSADLNRPPHSSPLSPRLQKDPLSPGPSKATFGKKATANSRLPLEQAPLRQQNANREPHNLAGKIKEEPAKGSYAPSTIYGQIEKRITDPEFKGSGKDLRALKQILEAMQKTKIRLENQQEEVDLESQTSRRSLDYNNCNQHPRSPIKHEGNNYVVTTIKSSGAHTTQKLVHNSSPHISAVAFSQFQKHRVQDGKAKGFDSEHKQIRRDQRPVRSNPQQLDWQSPHEEKKIKGRLLNTVQLSKETRHKKEQNLTVPTKSSGSTSPQRRQNQHVLEKKNKINNSSSVLGMAREQSGSPNRKPKVKSSYLQGEDRKHKLNRVMRDSFHQDDDASLLSESNNSSATQMDTDFSSTFSYDNGCKQQGGHKNQDLALRLRNNTPTGELVIPTAEQPSPISVLDASFYREESLSPVKKKSTPFTDDDSLYADEAEWSPEILDGLQETRVPNSSVELYNIKMEDIRSLVYQLDQLTVPRAATTDHIESLFHNTKPDQCYITKILLASGLLQDISFLSIPVQVHSNGHVINPNLFHVLEQTERQNGYSVKTSQMKMKIQRKIVFDTVNEILSQKLVSDKSIPLGLRSGSGIELLKEVQLEVESLQKLAYSSNDEDEDEDHDQEVLAIFGADMARESQGWKDCRGEIPSLVLDIERLIFKDLISDFINHEIA